VDARLKGAREEGRRVAACLKGALGIDVRVQQERVSKDEFLGLKVPPRLVYLATHGFFVPPAAGLPVDDPLLCCGIAFAGHNVVPAGKGKKAGSLPGLLTGAEVLAANLRGTDLVVLSACESGTGQAPYGQSPADLRHAFHLAGARAVVSSLWSVADRHTRGLLVPFIESLARQGRADKAEALNEAQRRKIKELRASPDRHAHPFFWAAFTLSGA
jgi:CHAT domain-containing protein